MRFNPVLRMEEQFCDVLLAHNPGMTRYEAIKRAQELLEIVDIHPSRLRTTRTSSPAACASGW